MHAHSKVGVPKLDLIAATTAAKVDQEVESVNDALESESIGEIDKPVEIKKSTEISQDGRNAQMGNQRPLLRRKRTTAPITSDGKSDGF